LRADATTQKKRPYEDIDGKQMIINQVIKWTLTYYSIISYLVRLWL
jgi:hypothetical protein